MALNEFIETLPQTSEEFTTFDTPHAVNRATTLMSAVLSGEFISVEFNKTVWLQDNDIKLRFLCRIILCLYITWHPLGFLSDSSLVTQSFAIIRGMYNLTNA